MALPTPAPDGTSTRLMPIFSATRQACTGPPPPKAISVRPSIGLADLDRMHARGVGHVLVDHLDDAERRHLGGQAQPAADMRRPAHRAPRSGSSRSVPPAKRAGS